MYRKKIIISLSIFLGICLIFFISWLLVREYEKIYPSQPLAPEEKIQQTADEFGITPEMLELITPPPDAKPIEITPEILELITPPPDAKPIEITPEMLELITPPPDAKPIEITPEMLELITPPK